MIPVALTVAGSDPSGGAGIQADLKTFHQFRVYGEAVITLLTVQNTRTGSRVELLSPELIWEQIAAVLADIPPGAVKTGALGSAAIIETVAGALAGTRLVVDPVMISKHGATLMSRDSVTALRRLLLPKAALVTPNLPEAAELAGIAVDSLATMREAALRIADQRAVLRLDPNDAAGALQINAAATWGSLRGEVYGRGWPDGVKFIAEERTPRSGPKSPISLPRISSGWRKTTCCRDASIC